MTSPAERISRRKAEHIAAALNHDVTATVEPGWDDVTLVHQALPEVNRRNVELGVRFLGHRLGAPLVFSALTGGADEAAVINERLARVAQRFNLAMGVGSQRAMAIHPALGASYRVVRDAAPDAFLLANVGAPQLIAQDGNAPVSHAEIRMMMDGIEANALAVHLNFLQECIQENADTDAAGVLDAIHQLCSSIGVPVITKETGSGLSREAARQLANAGVAALDTGGAGGSSMALMEARRAEERGDRRLSDLGHAFSGWGVPTAASILEIRDVGLPIIATGGVRSGVDAAKALALGATLVGVGRPALEAASRGEDALVDYVETFLLELRTAMFLTGSRNLSALRQARTVIRGDLAAWCDQPQASSRPLLP